MALPFSPLLGELLQIVLLLLERKVVASLGRLSAFVFLILLRIIGLLVQLYVWLLKSKFVKDELREDCKQPIVVIERLFLKLDADLR